MVIFELPATRHGGDIRSTALGSCRIRNPISVLRDQGELRIRAEGPTPTHTAAEALQSLAVVLGEQTIPPALSTFVFESAPGPPDRLARALREGIDVFVLEISDDKQFSYDGICLNQNFVSRNLVQAHRGALLDWYREICRGRLAEESSVQTALTKLRDSGARHDGPMADLLRGIRLERSAGLQIAETLGALTEKMQGRWIVVGPFAIPGDDGDIMRRRRAFNEDLSAASARCGALFYDPSQLLLTHGVATALAGGGVDIYEYADSFYPTVGETLVGLARAVGPRRRRGPPHSPVAAPAAAVKPHAVRLGWSIRLEAKASKFAKHVRRVVRKTARGAARLIR